MALDLKAFYRLAWYYQILAVAGICGALMAGFWYQVLTPISDVIAKDAVEEKKLEDQIKENEPKQKNIAKLREETKELQAKLNLLKKDLPSEKETHQILEGIQQEVRLSELKIVGVRPSGTSDQTFYTEWPWEFEIIGAYDNIGLFLDRVRNMNRIVSVGKLRFSTRASSGPNASKENLRATFTATTYVYKEDPVPPPAKK